MFDRYAAEVRVLRKVRDGFSVDGSLLGEDFELPDDLALTITADVYFRLRDAYLDPRREAEDHFSRMEKIAALSTLSVMIVRPCKILKDTPQAFKINPFFGLAVGFLRIGAEFRHLDPRTLERMAGWLDKFRIASAGQVLDVVHAARTAPFALEPTDAPMPLLDHEVFDIHLLVSFYDVLKRLVNAPRNGRK